MVLYKLCAQRPHRAGTARNTPPLAGKWKIPNQFFRHCVDDQISGSHQMNIWVAHKSDECCPTQSHLHTSVWLSAPECIWGVTQWELRWVLLHHVSDVQSDTSDVSGLYQCAHRMCMGPAKPYIGIGCVLLGAHQATCPGASNRQVWACHLAPTTPGPWPSLPSQFHMCPLHQCFCSFRLVSSPTIPPCWGKRHTRGGPWPPRRPRLTDPPTLSFTHSPGHKLYNFVPKKKLLKMHVAPPKMHFLVHSPNIFSSAQHAPFPGQAGVKNTSKKAGAHPSEKNCS